MAEKFATTWTGELTVVALGETMVTFCAKATVAAIRNKNGVRLRKNLSTKKILHNGFFVSHTSTLTRGAIHQVDVLSGRGERAIFLRFTINKPSTGAQE